LESGTELQRSIGAPFENTAPIGGTGGRARGERHGEV